MNMFEIAGIAVGISLIFFFWAYVFSAMSESDVFTPEEKLNRRIVSNILKWCGLGLYFLGGLIGLCWLIGWFWYYFCGGFLVVDVADTFTEKVLYGFVTLLGVGFFVGLIAQFKD